MDIVEKATQIAVMAHKEQVRKTDGTPYVAHPLSVARILDKAGFDDDIVAAAIVHDVLEDTEVTEAALRAQLGDMVTAIVIGVSEDKDLIWEERKEQYVSTVAKANEGVKAVSIADKIHNAMSMIDIYKTLGPSMWTKFSRGKKEKIWFERLLLVEVGKTWNHPLLKQYDALIQQIEDLPE